MNQLLGDSWASVNWQFVPDEDLVLIDGDDSEAMPVLIELLASRNPKVRGIALNGLENRWEFIREANEGLLAALDDPDPVIRDRVRLLLFRYDPESAKAAGLRWLDGHRDR